MIARQNTAPFGTRNSVTDECPSFSPPSSVKPELSRSSEQMKKYNSNSSSSSLRMILHSDLALLRGVTSAADSASSASGKQRL